MLNVTIASSEVRNMQGIAKASQKPYNLFFQTAYFHTMDKNGKPFPFPEKVEIILDKDEVGNPKSYAPGDYILHPASVYVDQNGKLAVAPKLVARQSAKP